MSQRSFIRRRPVATLTVLAGAGLAVLVWQHRAALQAFPSIISAYTAKEYCSCRYVMNNPQAYCRGYVKQYVPSTLVDDPARKSVKASGLGRTASATWLGVRQGCRLDP